MKIGYARVSTNDQTLALQQDALKAAGCEKIFTDQGISGAATTRPGLDQALKALHAGDTLVVWKLDRLGRSLSHLVQIMADFKEREIGFESVTEKIDTASSTGRLVLHIAAVFSEFERSLITERTRAGIAAAKRRGVKLGRKPTLTPAQIAHARSLVESGESPRAVARTFRVGRTTLWRFLKSEAEMMPFERRE
jgi:DNA invertase Pin-like site-specific DNA recombinase